MPLEELLTGTLVYLAAAGIAAPLFATQRSAALDGLSV